MNLIQEGDHVAVNFMTAQYTLSSRAEVVHTPSATGDSWVFRDVATGAIHHVSEGCTITKLEKP